MSNGEALKPGDVVRLKSGGAKMTINVIKPLSNDEVIAECTWHDWDGTCWMPMDRAYRVVALELATAPEAT